VSVNLSSHKGAPRRIVLSCDVAGCPVQVEPSAAEQWRSDPDARSWARDHALGWTYDPDRQTDYCPAHAAHRTASVGTAVPPRPTATARDEVGNPCDRDEYAVLLQARLRDDDRSRPVLLTAGQAAVTARLLDELTGVYRGETLGTLAHDLSAVLDDQLNQRR
jgi:hypothetical protein